MRITIVNSYSIDDTGEIRNKYGKILKPSKSKKGYMRIVLSNNTQKKTYFIHRLVGLYFVSNPDNKPFINHKDGNKLNNHKDNLEWCTNSDNIKHAYSTGLRIALKGTNNGYCSIPDVTIDNIKEDRKKGMSLQSIANKYNISKTHTFNITKGYRR